MTQPSWAIVATVDEPAQLVIAFAAYHLAIGAAELHLFLDQPNPEAEAALAGMPGLHLTVCDEAYWAHTSPEGRPEITTARQIANFEAAYRATEADWMLHIDADEFVRDAGQIRRAIAAAPEFTVFFQLGMLERVHLLTANDTGIFDGVFRRYTPDTPHWVDEVYGRFTKFMPEGLSAHRVGKALVRTGLDGLQLNIHFPRWQHREHFPRFRRMPGALYHFDGLTPLHVVLKLLGRFDWQGIGESRNLGRTWRGAQIRFVRNNRMKRRELERLVYGLKFLTPEQEKALDDHRALVRQPFDPRPQLLRMGVAPDLSRAGFDAALSARMADRLAQTAFADSGWTL